MPVSMLPPDEAGPDDPAASPTSQINALGLPLQTAYNDYRQAQSRLHRPGAPMPPEAQGPWPFASAAALQQDYRALEERIRAAAQRVQGGVTNGTLSPYVINTRRMFWEDGISALRGRSPRMVVMDDLEDLRAMRLTPHAPRDDMADALEFIAVYAAGCGLSPRVVSRTSQRALVPVGPLRRVAVERFDKNALQEIDRPIHERLMAERRRMRFAWEDLLERCLHDCVRRDQTPVSKHSRTFHVPEEVWWGLPESPFCTEVNRVHNMLLEDDIPFEDILRFSVGVLSGPRMLADVPGVFLCWGPGVKQHRYIDATQFRISE